MIDKQTKTLQKSSKNRTNIHHFFRPPNFFKEKNRSRIELIQKRRIFAPFCPLETLRFEDAPFVFEKVVK